MFPPLISQEWSSWGRKQEGSFALFEALAPTWGVTPLCVFPWPVGDGGDQPHPADAWLHVHMPRHHQREGQGGPEDVLREHRDVTVPFSEQLGVLRIRPFLARRASLQDRTTHFLTAATFVSAMFDVRALPHPPEPCRTSSCDPVAYCLVSACTQIVLPLALCLLLSKRRRERVVGEHSKTC